MVLQILRAAFILLFVSVTLLYILSYQAAALFRGLRPSLTPGQIDDGVPLSTILAMFGIAFGIALAVVAIDSFTKRKRLSAVSGVFLGLIAGLLAAYALSFVVDLIGLLLAPEGSKEQVAFLDLLEGVKVLIGLITCYVGISLVMQTKDDFRFVLPYVEFAKQIRGNRPTLLDTSVIIDGRILDIVQTRTLQGLLIVPRFVLNELHMIADSADKLRRVRGRRGLDILQKLQDNPDIEVNIDDGEVEGMGVDQKLVIMAQQTQARIMTNDYNLNKIATLRGVQVININDLAKAMRPVVLPGETMNVRIVKAGEGSTQGIGYLDDGSMVVVEHGRGMIGRQIELAVTSTLQTSSGNMIFGRLLAAEKSPPLTPSAISSDEHATAITPAALAADKSSFPRSSSRRSSGRNPRRG